MNITRSRALAVRGGSNVMSKVRALFFGFLYRSGLASNCYLSYIAFTGTISVALVDSWSNIIVGTLVHASDLGPGPSCAFEYYIMETSVA